MKVPLLDLKAQYAPLRAEIRAAMDEVCDAQQFILGARVQAFEAHVAVYCGVPYAVSFCATLGSIVRLGAFPLMADIAPLTFTLSPAGVRALLETPPRRLKK